MLVAETFSSSPPFSWCVLGPQKFLLCIGANLVPKSVVMFIMGGLLKMDTKPTGIGAAAMIFAYQGSVFPASGFFGNS